MASYVNRFNLLSDEPAAPKAAPAAAPAPVAQAPSNKGAIPASEINNNNGHRGGRGGARGRRGGRGGGELGSHGQNSRPAHGEQTNYRTNDAAPRGERQYRPRGETRQRTHDGHTAGTGYQGRGAKRDGAGRYNFGSPTDTTVPPVDGEAAPAADGEAPAAEAAVEEAAPAPVEEEDKTLTLEQYLRAQQEKLLAEDLNKQLRVAGEDIEEDEREIRATKPLERADEDEDILGAGVFRMKSSGSKKHSKSDSGAKKLSLDEFTAGVQPARDGGRGGFRGGFRGGRGGRGGNAGASVNLADQSAFPTLGKK